MGGITNYFHGEMAEIVDRSWVTMGPDIGDGIAFTIQLADNPHRVVARDYGADIGIDPGLVTGNTAVYLRLDDTSGIWVDISAQHGPALRAAIGRVLQNRKWMERWKKAESLEDVTKIASQLIQATGVATGKSVW